MYKSKKEYYFDVAFHILFLLIGLFPVLAVFVWAVYTMLTGGSFD